MGREHYHIVTGRLAEQALRSILVQQVEAADFDYTVEVLPITVAALMSPAWVARHIHPDSKATRILLPGYCEGEMQELERVTQLPIERGPRDLRQLPEYFGRPAMVDGYGAYDIEILAEINHAPRLSLDEILRQARQLIESGADLIDVGCEPDGSWRGVGECVQALRAEGWRVSIDSFQPREIESAVCAGAELVLSVNASNRDAAADWGCEVVVIPDELATLAGLEETIEKLVARNVRFRLDPVLEPIGCGFAASLGRYLEVRRRYPDAEMLMGIGNLTELSDADSAPINLLLLGFCQEVGIRSVLTTQVINWARSSVRECDLARRMVHYAFSQRIPPKHVDERYVVLRDPRLWEYGAEQMELLANQVRDHNYRVVAEGGYVHLISAGLHLSDTDPFRLFEQLLARQPRNLDASHAFYLGYELCKAATALALGKQYEQDESLNWGFLTRAEPKHHRLK